MWRDWKRRLKAEYFTPYKDDPDYDFSQQPNEQVEMNQWLDLDQYWRKKQVQDLAKQNAGNRARKKHLHRAVKKPFQRLKQEVVNVLGSAHGSQINSDENAQQKQHQAHSFLNISKSPGLVVGKSSRENYLYDSDSVQVGSNVILHSSEIPKEAVAEGVLLSIDPYEKRCSYHWRSCWKKCCMGVC